MPHPDVLAKWSLVASAVFGLFSIRFFYWALFPIYSGGFQWTGLERLGLATSGFGWLIMCARLGFPSHVPGRLDAYLLAALLLAFVMRPALEYAGLSHSKSE